MGQSWWNCEEDVWGRVGGIVKTMCGVEFVEFRRRYMGQIWWNFEDDVWGRVGGILKTICGAGLVEV